MNKAKFDDEDHAGPAQVAASESAAEGALEVTGFIPVKLADSRHYSTFASAAEQSLLLRALQQHTEFRLLALGSSRRRKREYLSCTQ